MTVRIIDDPPAPGTEAWRKMITASKIPAIMGASPWESPYSLAVSMQEDYEPPAVSDSKADLFLYGHSIEYALAHFWGQKNPDWDVSEGEVAFTNDTLPFANLVTTDRVATHKETGEKALLEFKSVSNFDTLKKWGKPGTPNSVPLNYRLQVLSQMGVSGIHTAYVVMASIGVPEVHEVKWNAMEWLAILKHCTAFTRNIEAGNLPDLDDHTATYEAVRGQHPDIDEGSVVVVEWDQANELAEAKEALTAAKARETEAKTKMLATLGNAQKAVCNGVVVARRQRGRNGNAEMRVPSALTDQLAKENT